MGDFVVLTICTGNVCRSPAAELLIASAHLPELVVSSAGLGAPPGHPISSQIAELLADDGVLSQQHRARPLSREHLGRADLVLTMTTAQRSEVVDRSPRLLRRAYTLPELAAIAELPELAPAHDRSADAYRQWLQRASRLRSRARGVDPDIPDPWGGSPQDYRHAYELVRGATRTVLEALGSHSGHSSAPPPAPQE